MGAHMNHQPPPSYLSVVLRPLPCSHLPLHTLLLNTPLSWLHPPSSIQNLLKWDRLEKSRHGYDGLQIYNCIVCMEFCPLVYRLCTYTVVLMCYVLIEQQGGLQLIQRQQPVLMGPPGSRTTQVCVCFVHMHGCGCVGVWVWVQPFTQDFFSF